MDQCSAAHIVARWNIRNSSPIADGILSLPYQFHLEVRFFNSALFSVVVFGDGYRVLYCGGGAKPVHFFGRSLSMVADGYSIGAKCDHVRRVNDRIGQHLVVRILYHGDLFFKTIFGLLYHGVNQFLTA